MLMWACIGQEDQWFDTRHAFAFEVSNCDVASMKTLCGLEGSLVIPPEIEPDKTCKICEHRSKQNEKVPSSTFYTFDTPDPKSRLIRSQDKFEVKIALSPEFKMKLAKQASRDCVICFGKGFLVDTAGLLRFCNCIESQN